MSTLIRKKELILERETAFAYALGAKVIEKPKVSFWMVLVPFLFLYFIYGIQKFKKNRTKFKEEFIVTPRQALEVAFRSLQTGRQPDINAIPRLSDLPAVAEKPYLAWVRALVDHYMDLMAADGDTFAALVRSAYGSRTNYLLALNRLSIMEKELYASLRSSMADIPESSDVMAAIQDCTQSLRRSSAENIFPS